METNIPLWLDISLQVVVLTIMLFGLTGLIVPIVPGLVIIWLAMLGFGIVSGFGTLGWVVFAISTILMVAGSFIDNILMGTRAHKSGASWISILLALIFGIAGNFVVPVLGGLLAALLALFISEWIRRKNRDEAWKATIGMVTGFSLAVIVRFIMGLVMIGLWMMWAWI
jgi:uncharacterized protein